MDHILVPLDGSTLGESVLPYVKLVAKATNAQVDLLMIAEPQEGPTKKTTAPARSTAVKAAEAYVEKVSKYFIDARCHVTHRVAVGVPAAQIIRATEQDPITMTAMSTHGRSGVTRWMLGSVTDKVLRGGAGPLLVVRPAPRSPIGPELDLKRVVVPLDGSAQGEEVLPQVVNLANALDLQVVLVRVTPSVMDYLRWASGGEYGAVAGSIQDFTETAEAVDAEAMEYLDKVCARLQGDGLKPTAELEHGDPAQAIIDMVSDADGSFVAMTTSGRTGIARAALGSVADRVVRHCGAPVLLIRPAKS
ncbi:MAG: UspA domain protein [Dehalococcoidia bacterium]|nr:UspA domain protein [Dehalococcoidia bacterium]